MNLKEFKEIVDKAYEYAEETAPYVDVSVYFKKKQYEIRKISQFGLSPNVVIEIGEVEYDDNE